MNQQADLIFVNGHVLSLDINNHIYQAVAVKGRRIMALGDSLDLEKLKGPATKIIDLAGRTLMPGMIDAHCHAGIYGLARQQVACRGDRVKSIEDIVANIKQKAETTPRDEWILSRGYNETDLLEKRHPTRWDLDRAAPGHKVFMVRTCGHIAVVNSRVLRELNIDRNTPDPDGGRFERDAQGDPTGVLMEKAAIMVRMIARPTENDIYQGLRLMNHDFIRLGLTGIHDASGLYAEETRQFQKAVAVGDVQMRVYLMFRFSGGTNRLGEHLYETGLLTGLGNDSLKIGPYKLMLDGAGSGGTAAMFEPPLSRPGDTGLLYFDPKELDECLTRAHVAGYQIAVHAIGDRALTMLLESLEKIIKKYPRPDHRHRIEHFGFPTDQVLEKVGQLGLIPVLGLPFLYELGDQYLDIYGPKTVGRAYPLKKLVQAGIPAPMSSDAPVIGPDPLSGLHFALNRQTKKGTIIAPDQKVDLLSALRAYTTHSAYASFEEQKKGSLEIGKLADMIVWSENITRTPPEEILSLKVDRTFIDGQQVFKRN